MRSIGWGSCALMAMVLAGVTPAWADAFEDYAQTGQFQLPVNASSFDVLNDGRIVTMVGADVYVESAVGTGTFSSLGTLPGGDVGSDSFATAFVRVSPDGARIAVGNNGGPSFANPEVGVFTLSGLTGGWFSAQHFDAAWIDDSRLAMTGGAFGQPSSVSAVDISTMPLPLGSAVTLVENIGGAPGGIVFDPAGNLLTSNGFDGAGPSGTGHIRAFAQSDWLAALAGGPAIDFESSGTLLADVLSGGSLGFDAEGNLHVGGGDFLGGADVDFAALIRESAIANALGGGGPADVGDPSQVRMLDPDAASDFNFYDLNFNPVSGELYVREGSTVYSYMVPEPGTLLVLLVGAGFVPRRRP